MSRRSSSASPTPAQLRFLDLENRARNRREESAGETRAQIYARTKAGEKRSREEAAPFDEARYGAWFTRPLRLEKDVCVRPQVGARAQLRFRNPETQSRAHSSSDTTRTRSAREEPVQ